MVQRKPRHGQSLPAVRHIRTHKAIKFKSRSRESCAEYVLRSVNASLTSFWQRCSAREGPGFCKGDGVLPLTRARRCSAWQDKSPRELRERLVAHSSFAVALIVFIGTYFAAAAIYFAVIALAVDALARAFKVPFPWNATSFGRTPKVSYKNSAQLQMLLLGSLSRKDGRLRPLWGDTSAAYCEPRRTSERLGVQLFPKKKPRP